MSVLKGSLKRGRETSASRSIDSLPEVALAAIVSSKKQNEVGEFITLLLTSLERNSSWLSNIVDKQTHFRCALMVGAGPNRFQLQEIIYPSDGKEIKLEVELKESEDHDKIAIAALVKLTNLEIMNMLDYIKTRLYDNLMLKEDLLKGKAMGIGFAVLRPFSERQYRVMERIVIGNSMRCVLPFKKRREDKSSMRPPIKKAKRVA